MMDHATLLARIKACESGPSGRALLADPDCAAVYPLARQRVVAANLAGVTAATLGRSGGLGAQLRGLCNIARHEGLAARHAVPHGPVTLAMLSYTTSRLFQLPGGWPDAYAEPFMAAAEATGGRGALLEVPALGEYRTPPIRVGHLLGMDELRARLAGKLRSRPAPAVDGIAGFVDLWRAEGLDTANLDGAGWARVWNHFDRRRARFARQLARLAPELGVVVTWYGTTSLAFTTAAQEMGIPVADLQHGVQGPSHGMYGHWPREALTSPLIPRAFLTWGTAEAVHLRSWIGDERRTYVCGLPWLHMDQDLLATSPDYRTLKQAAGDRPIMLVSLQPDPRALLDLVEATLAQPGANHFAWALRCHPGQLEQVNTIAERFAGHGEVLPVREATLAPLGLVLGLSTAHLTEFSSVVLEAAAAGIPSFLSSECGRGLFPYMGSDELSVTPNSDALLAALKTVSSRPAAEQNCKHTPQTALAAFRADAKADAFSLAQP
jgi:hypothetical protein